MFITGAFNVAATTFGGVSLNHTAVGSSSDIFIVKYDGQGNLLWAKNTGYTNTIWVYDIATDSQGNALITGSFASAPITFGSTTLQNFANVNPFLVKYDPLGNVMWAIGAQQTLYYGVTVWSYGVATDVNDNIYITGDYAKTASSNLSFGPHSLPICSGRNMYVVKYDNSGNELWAKASMGSSYGGVQATGFDITTDLSGNCIILGSFNTPTISFGGITLTNSSAINGVSEVFVLKYDSSGNEVWAKNAGGTGDDEGHKISSDDAGNVYVTGYFESKPASFGSFTINKQNSSSPLFFVVKYNDLGNEVWVKYIEKTDAFGGGLMTNGVSADDFGNVYVTGSATDSNQYGSAVFGSTTLTYGGVFIAKLGETVIGIDEVNDSEHKTVVIFPNPGNGVFNIKSNAVLKDGSLKVYNIYGQVVFESAQLISEMNLSKQPVGVYFIQLKSEGETINRRLVVQ